MTPSPSNSTLFTAVGTSMTVSRKTRGTDGLFEEETDAPEDPPFDGGSKEESGGSSPLVTIEEEGIDERSLRS